MGYTVHGVTKSWTRLNEFHFQSEVWVGFESLLLVSQVGAVFRKNLHLINGVYANFKNCRNPVGAR